jgi:hypothetical protein
MALQYAHVEEHIPETRAEAVTPTQRQQRLVYFNKVTFQ